MLKRVYEQISNATGDSSSTMVTPTKTKGFSAVIGNTPPKRLVTEVIMRDIIDPTNNELVAVMLENTYCLREFMGGTKAFEVKEGARLLSKVMMPATGTPKLQSNLNLIMWKRF